MTQTMEQACSWKPVRILFLIRSLNYGGSERQLVALAAGFRQRGESVAVATFYPGGTLLKELEDSGVQVFSLGKRSRWDIVGFLWRWGCLLRLVSPTVLHSYLGSANILSVLARLLLPATTVVWGVRSSNMELERYGSLDRLLYWIECRLSCFANLIIANSCTGRNYAIAHGFPSAKLIVIPNGIDVQRFRPDRTARERFRKGLGVADTESLIGLVGRIDPMKGHATFLRAAAILLNKREDVRFICVGEGPKTYSETLLSLAVELELTGKVIWAGATTGMEAVYNSLDIVTCCSSYGEGFSNVIGEAMACGVPCVVTDVGDAKEIVGDAGYVVVADDTMALVEAWCKVLGIGEAERLELGVRARARIIQSFSLDRLIEATFCGLKTMV